MQSSNLALIRKYKNALKKFADIFNKAKPKEKHQYIYPIRSAGISFSNAKELGFYVKKKTWLNCFDQSDRDKGKCLFL